MLWYKIYCDGTELDIALADSAENAIRYIQWKFGYYSGVWSWRYY